MLYITLCFILYAIYTTHATYTTCFIKVSNPLLISDCDSTHSMCSRPFLISLEAQNTYWDDQDNSLWISPKPLPLHPKFYHVYSFLTLFCINWFLSILISVSLFDSSVMFAFPWNFIYLYSFLFLRWNICPHLFFEKMVYTWYILFITVNICPSFNFPNKIILLKTNTSMGL